MTPITDPALLQQLEGAPSVPQGLQPVAPTTATFLDQLSAAPPRMTKASDARLGPQGMDLSGLRNSVFGSFARGIRDPVDAGAQLLAHGVAAIAPNFMQPWAQQQVANTENANREAERDYREDWMKGAPPSFDIGRIAGNIGAFAPLASVMPGAAAPSLIARMGSGALSGGVSGALQPAEPGATDFWQQKAEQTGVGAGIGAVAPALMGALARVIRPNTNPDVQTLMDAGVRPTPGQVLGGTANRIEQAATSIPIAGDFIKNARRDATMQFDRGAINQALTPIGETLEAPKVGREAIAEMQRKVGENYDRLVSGLGIAAVDASGAPSAAATQLSGDLGSIMAASSKMPTERGRQLQSILQSEVFDRMSPAGGMTGESFQEAKSGLGKLSTEYLNSSSADERQLGGALLQAQVYLRDALRTANPDAAAQLSAADSAFAHMLRVQGAAARVGGEPGAFSAAQLQSAVRALDPTLRKRAFAAGDALMQDYAEAGKSVLGNTLPDSGTPYRNALMVGGGLLGAHSGAAMVGMPPQYTTAGALGYGALSGLAGLAYSPWGRAMIAHGMTTRPDFATPAAEMLRGASPAAGVAGAPLFRALGY